MSRGDLAGLLLLGALWGGSFLFMRLGADAFGGLPLAGVRAAGAALCFVPWLASARRRAIWRAHFVPIAVVGIANSALPYVLFALAAQRLPAGLSSIVDAATPLFVALTGRAFLGERLDASRALGLGVGFAGVLVLVGGAGLQAGALAGRGAALAACLLATVCYAFSVHYTRRRLAAVEPMVTAAGSQAVAAAVLAPAALWAWPARMPGAASWAAALALAVLCTALAYLLFYRLIARVGSARTMAVLYLIPAFGVCWGVLCLGERLTVPMVAGCAVILAGVALTTGTMRPRRRLASTA